MCFCLVGSSVLSWHWLILTLCYNNLLSVTLPWGFLTTLLGVSLHSWEGKATHVSCTAGEESAQTVGSTTLLGFRCGPPAPFLFYCCRSLTQYIYPIQVYEKKRPKATMQEPPIDGMVTKLTSNRGTTKGLVLSKRKNVFLCTGFFLFLKQQHCVMQLNSIQRRKPLLLEREIGGVPTLC